MDVGTAFKVGLIAAVFGLLLFLFIKIMVAI